jgi:hypothetical protein
MAMTTYDIQKQVVGKHSKGKGKGQNQNTPATTCMKMGPTNLDEAAKHIRLAYTP